jgi:hypothetical protein
VSKRRVEVAGEHPQPGDAAFLPQAFQHRTHAAGGSVGAQRRSSPTM